MKTWTKKYFERLRGGSAPCTWKDEDGFHTASCCGREFTFNDDGPVENGFKFCPYCGQPIITR